MSKDKDNDLGVQNAPAGVVPKEWGRLNYIQRDTVGRFVMLFPKSISPEKRVEAVNRVVRAIAEGIKHAPSMDEATLRLAIRAAGDAGYAIGHAAGVAECQVNTEAQRSA